jgi:hypothetical protein
MSISSLALAALFFSFLAGCQKTLKTSDPQLRPIQEMLDSELPTGSSQAKVLRFLDTRGYPTEQAQKPGTIVTVIRMIDTRRLEPVTARVTFYFDANGKLNTFELQRMENQPIQ